MFRRTVNSARFLSTSFRLRSARRHTTLCQLDYLCGYDSRSWLIGQRHSEFPAYGFERKRHFPDHFRFNCLTSEKWANGHLKPRAVAGCTAYKLFSVQVESSILTLRNQRRSPLVSQKCEEPKRLLHAKTYTGSIALLVRGLQANRAQIASPLSGEHD
jgi:hypothetical protein